MGLFNQRRKHLSDGQQVRVVKSGYDSKKVFRVQYDYEDLIYLYGIREPFQPNEIKLI